MEKRIDEICKNYTINELLERYTKLLSENERLIDENRELRRQLENKELSETNSEPLLPDYEEVQDNNGRVWYKRTHFNVQRKDSRLLEKYDVIVAKRDLEEPYPTIILIDSFDYESDFAARCFYGKSVYYKDYERKNIRKCGMVDLHPVSNIFHLQHMKKLKNYLIRLMNHLLFMKIVLQIKRLKNDIANI